MRSLAHVLVGSCCSRSSGRHERGFNFQDEFGEDLALARNTRDEEPPKTPRGLHGGGQGYPFSPKIPHQDDLQNLAKERYDEGTSTSQFLASLATVSVALTIYFYEAASYNLIFLGRILPARDKAALILPFGVIFNLVWCLAIWSYLQAHLSDPGTVPRRWRDFARSLGDALPVAPPRLEWQPGKATWCKKCCIARPERAHHCHVCGICVLRMDHHCPYIFNCVGFNNHKHFLLLIVYTTAACSIVLLTALPDFLYYVYVLLDVQEDTPLHASELWGFLISCVLDILLLLVLAPMVPAHIALARRNQTSIEGNYNNMPNPFDLGEAQANLQQLLGAYGPDWFFPVPPLRPVSDGVSFPKADEDEADFEPELSDKDLGEEGTEKRSERLWRMRYGVRRLHSPDRGQGALGSPRQPSGPLDAITLWWRSL